MFSTLSAYRTVTAIVMLLTSSLPALATEKVWDSELRRYITDDDFKYEEFMTEDEAVKANGSYPLAAAATLNVDYTNPFGGDAYADGAAGNGAGVCYYDVSDDQTSYVITANGKDGTSILVLSNTVN